MFKELEKLVEVKEKYQKQMEKEGKKAVVAGAKALFAECPNLQAVRWTQYTPHFNDGEPCEFDVHEPSFGFATEEEAKKLAEYVDHDGDEEDEEEEGESSPGLFWADSWCIKGRGTAPMKEFSKAICGLEDALEAAFGDGVEIVLHRDGSVDVQEYEHD